MSFGHWLENLQTRLVVKRQRSKAIRQIRSVHRRRAVSHSAASEFLEERVLLAAAAVTGTTLNVVDNASEVNSVTVRLSGDGMSLIINDSTTPLTAGSGTTAIDANTVSVPVNSVTETTFNLGSNDNTLALDFVAGNPIQTDGVTFNSTNGLIIAEDAIAATFDLNTNAIKNSLVVPASASGAITFTDLRGTPTQGTDATIGQGTLSVSFVNSTNSNSNSFVSAVTTDMGGNTNIEIDLSDDGTNSIATFADIQAAIAANGMANSLVSVSNNSSVGFVEVAAPASLTGGVDGETVTFTDNRATADAGTFASLGGTLSIDVNSAGVTSATAFTDASGNIIVSVDIAPGATLADVVAAIAADGTPGGAAEFLSASGDTNGTTLVEDSSGPQLFADGNDRANSDVSFTDVRPDPGIGTVRVEFSDPAAANQVLTVVVAGTANDPDITVSLATDSAGNITSTAADVAAAINADGAASLIVSALAQGDGSELVSDSGGLANGVVAVGSAALTLTNVGNRFVTQTYNYISVKSGNVTLRDGLVDFTIDYTGLDTISNDGTTTNAVFNLPAGSNSDAVLQDSGTGSDGIMQLAGSNFEDTLFSVATASSLKINGNNGNDSITITAADSLLTGSLSVSGMAGTDTIDATASSVGLVIDGGDGADTITGSNFADLISGGLGSDLIRGEDSASGTGGADTIVGGVANPMVVFETNFGNIPIELFADLAPNTVASFLNYVTDDDYLNSIIHRSIPGFVIQGGGFTTSQESFVQGTTVISAVPTDPPIFNEGNALGNRSNVRGTISTAQQGGNINTFTSQWFVNLVDNDGSGLNNLDTVPHVVFGNVLDMTVPDLIAALNIFNITAATGNGALTDTPLSDTPASGNGNLVVVNSVVYSIIPSSTSVAVDGDDEIFGGIGADTIFGSGGDDTLMGNADADSMIGGDGNDIVNGNAGDDTAFGNAGDDTLMGGSEADSLVGGDGNDMVRGQGASDDTVSGGAGDDTLDGGPGPSTLVESADGDFTLVSGLVAGEGTLTGSVTGTDVLIEIERAQLTGGASANNIDASGFNGPVTLDGGGGADVLTGGDGGATITGGAGNDTITGGAGADDLRGGEDNDSILGGDGQDTILGDAGNDILNGGGDNDTISGSAGADTIDGGAGDDMLNGNGGSGDILTGGAGNDTLDGGDGDDRVSESADTDFVLTDTSLTSAATGTDSLTSIEGGILNGGAGANSIDASAFSGTSTLNGAGGDDILLASAQASMLTGGAGNDSLTGGAQNDVITGGTENDTINGGAGNDSLSGGDNDDLINGGLGADTISGGDGNDRLIGESNADVTAAVTTLAALNIDNSDSIDGGLGNDTIVGGLGADTVNGGDGLDIIDVASGGNTANGVDSVITSLGGDLVFADPEDIIA
tara:strand:+ start:17906 stop:22102 length:4197 start_codon:yes stop_codon:yes gene_type:complete